MPLARTYDKARGAVITTMRDGFEDRLSKWSDIREYMPFLHETAKSYPQVRVLELGARRGNSTLAFLAAAAAVDGHVTSVDVDRVADAPDGMLPWRKAPWWTFIRGDDMDGAVQASLPVEVDVLFIDTSHEYEHTLGELRAYMPRVVPGGVALLHDTRVFVNQAGKGVSSLVPHHGETVSPVARALDEYCAGAGLSWENMDGVYGLGVVRT